MSDDFITQVLRGTRHIAGPPPPGKHPDRTQECPLLSRVGRALAGEWTGSEIGHVRECAYCQKTVAMFWAQECPSSRDVAQYGLDPTHYFLSEAMAIHLRTVECARCRLLLEFVQRHAEAAQGHLAYLVAGDSVEAAWAAGPETEISARFLFDGRRLQLVFATGAAKPDTDLIQVLAVAANRQYNATVRLRKVSDPSPECCFRGQTTLAVEGARDLVLASWRVDSLATHPKRLIERDRVSLRAWFGRGAVTAWASFIETLVRGFEIPRLAVGIAGVAAVAIIGAQFLELRQRSGMIRSLEARNGELSTQLRSRPAEVPAAALETYAIQQVPSGVMGVEEKPEEIVLPIPDAQSTKVRLPLTGLGSLDPAAPIQASLSDAKGATVWGPAHCAVRDSGGKSIVVVEIPAAVLAGHIRQGLVLQLNHDTGTLAAIGLRFQ